MSLKVTLDNIQQALQNETQIENNRYQETAGSGAPPRCLETQANCVSQTSARTLVEAQVVDPASMNNQVNQSSGQMNQSTNRPVEHVYPTVQTINPQTYQQYYQLNSTHAPQPPQQVHPRTSGVIYQQAPTAATAPGNHPENHRKSKRKTSPTINKTNEEILNSLKRILEKHEKEDRDYEVVQEWRRVAQCVDRILFFIFLIATLTSTIGILVIAPATQ